MIYGIRGNLISHSKNDRSNSAHPLLFWVSCCICFLRCCFLLWSLACECALCDSIHLAHEVALSFHCWSNVRVSNLTQNWWLLTWRWHTNIASTFFLLNFFFFGFLIMLLVVLFDKFELSLSRFSMYISVELRMGEEFLIVFHELSSCLFIQTALRERHNQQTLNNFENVGERPIAWVPILL